MKPLCAYCGRPSHNRRILEGVGPVDRWCERFIASHPDTLEIPKEVRAGMVDDFRWGPLRRAMAREAKVRAGRPVVGDPFAGVDGN